METMTSTPSTSPGALRVFDVTVTTMPVSPHPSTMVASSNADAIAGKDISSESNMLERR